MARLTVGMMEQIAAAVCAHRYEAQGKALQAQSEAAGRRLYDELFPPALLAKVAKAPPEFIYHSDTLRIDYQQARGNSTLNVGFGEQRPLPMLAAHYGRFDLKGPHPLVEELLRLNVARRGLHETRAHAYKEIMGVLRGFATTKALRAGWPEVASFIPVEQATPDRPLQRVPAALNAKFKLPPEAPKPAAKKAAKKRAKK